MSAFNVKTATTAELVAKYNALTGKATKRFATRADGEKAVQRQLDAVAGVDSMKSRAAELAAGGREANAEARASAPVAVAAEAAPEAPPRAPWPTVTATPAPAAPVHRAKPRLDPMLKLSTDRSSTIARSWQNTAVAEARRERTNVTVDGKQYKSVGEAFRELRLPMGGHIKFRMELKREGKLTFTTPEGKQYNFAVVKATGSAA